MDDAGIERQGVGDAGIHHHLAELLIHLAHFLHHAVLAFFQQRGEDATPHCHSVGTECHCLVGVVAGVYTTVDKVGKITVIKEEIWKKSLAFA